MNYASASVPLLPSELFERPRPHWSQRQHFANAQLSDPAYHGPQNGLGDTHYIDVSPLILE